MTRRWFCPASQAAHHAPSRQVKRKVENTMVKALARAFRWKRMLETGEFTTIAELAEHEKIAPSCVTRGPRLTRLAPDIIEAILAGRQGPVITLAAMLDPFPMDRAAQIHHFGRPRHTGQVWDQLASGGVSPTGNSLASGAATAIAALQTVQGARS